MKNYPSLLLLLVFGSTIPCQAESPAEVLRQFVGTWSRKTTVMVPQVGEINSSATAIATYSQGGILHSRDIPVGEPEGQALVTYNEGLSKYVGSEVRNGATAQLSGTWDDESRTMSFVLESDAYTAEYTHRFISDDHAEIAGKVILREGNQTIVFKSVDKRTSDDTKTEEPDDTVTAEQVVTSMDKNDDEKISVSEADEDLRLYFRAYDKNKDGFIDREEAELIADYVNGDAKSLGDGKQPGKVTAEAIVKSMDADGDGTISPEEASADVKPHFANIDTNGDGKIDVSEAKVMADYVNRN